MLAGSLSRLTSLGSRRFFGVSSIARQSLFGEVTSLEHPKETLEPPKNENDASKTVAPTAGKADLRGNAIQYIDPSKDEKLQEFLKSKPIRSVDELLSPLKRELYLANVKQNGFFKNKQQVELKGSTYMVKLTPEEVKALEPSVYLESYRIKSTPKKANIVLRALKGLRLKEAITQLHFMRKKIATDLYILLERGLKDAETLGYNPEELYISEAWVGSDSHKSKRVECKGRGRTGIITHRHVNVKFVLRSDQTLRRITWEKSQQPKNNKIPGSVIEQKIRSKPSGFYKW
ncbi:hypothetical protein LJB42_000625 [Komagataella kurtzmanii]|nr:hypothetical protein LJB42_000625 [Komagataella kurtzmanii]